jgi:hypothetical protein
MNYTITIQSKNNGVYHHFPEHCLALPSSVFLAFVIAHSDRFKPEYDAQ